MDRPGLGRVAQEWLCLLFGLGMLGYMLHADRASWEMVLAALVLTGGPVGSAAWSILSALLGGAGTTSQPPRSARPARGRRSANGG